jgi:hypothetical protein
MAIRTAISRRRGPREATISGVPTFAVAMSRTISDTAASQSAIRD